MSTDTVVELRREQHYFDQAMEDHEESFKISSIDGGGVGTAAERRAMQKHRNSKVRLSPDDAVAYRKYQLDDGTAFYVGKTSIMNDAGDMTVINWQSKMGERLYQSTAQDPNGVVSRRDYRTTGNRIDQFSEILYQELAQKVSNLEDELRADPVLRTSLEAGRDGKMRDIVQTIQASQDKLIRADKDQLLIIQGGPGTGKTAVALHRASWLLYTYSEELRPEDVLVVGPSPSFTKYIRHVLPGLGDTNVKQTSIGELIRSPGIRIRNTDQETVAHLKGRAIMAQVIRQGIMSRIKVPSSTIRVRKRNSGSYYFIDPGQLRDDVVKLKSGHFEEGRQQIRARILEECGKQLLVRGAAAQVFHTIDTRSLENAVERIWPQISPQQYIRELLGSRTRLSAAGEGLLNHDEQKMLYRQSEGSMGKEMWTESDLALIDEAEYHLNSSPKLWGHIIVDEAQDLTPMQLRAIRRRSRLGSMTIVGDLAQSTGAFARDSWNDISEILKSNMPTNLEQLKHGYRVPREVYDIAAKLLPQVAKNVEPASIIRESGSTPRLFKVIASQYAKEIAKQASHHSSKGRFVGVIAPYEQFDQLRAAFKTLNVKFSDSSFGELGELVNLVSPENSKGLEFDAVIIGDPQAILDTDAKWGARLLYIALTRSTRLLDVVAPADEVPEILLGDHFQTISIDRADEEDEPQVQPVLAIEHDSSNEENSADLKEPEADTSLSEFESASIVAPEFSAIQLELISQNAQYLHSLLQDSFRPGMAKAIMEAALGLMDEDPA